jgi:pentatricopeptide repeat protein
MPQFTLLLLNEAILICQLDSLHTHRHVLHCMSHNTLRACCYLTARTTHCCCCYSCGTGGEWQRGLELLSAMRGQGFALSLLVFNSAIEACEKGGQHSHALDLIAQMKQQGTAPDKWTYGSAIR